MQTNVTVIVSVKNKHGGCLEGASDGGMGVTISRQERKGPISLDLVSSVGKSTA